MFHTIVAVQGTKIIKKTKRNHYHQCHQFVLHQIPIDCIKYDLKTHFQRHSADMKYNYNQSDDASVEAGSLRAHEEIFFGGKYFFCSNEI